MMDYELIMNKAKAQIAARADEIKGRHDTYHNGLYVGLLEALSYIDGEIISERRKND
jgi:hypothetical protein